MLTLPDSTTTNDVHLWTRRWREMAERLVGTMLPRYCVFSNPTPDWQFVLLAEKEGGGADCVLPLGVILDLLGGAKGRKTPRVVETSTTGRRRVVSPPKEKRAKCQECGAITAYTQRNVRDINMSDHHGYTPAIRCAACGANVRV